MAPLCSMFLRSPSHTLLHLLLCFVVLMQILGAPTSMWQLEFQDDPLDASALEGFSLISTRAALAPPDHRLRRSDLMLIRSSVLLSNPLFRPPSGPRPLMVAG